jgi:hypothetical protein
LGSRSSLKKSDDRSNNIPLKFSRKEAIRYEF